MPAGEKIRLTKALSAWATGEFKDVLKRELEQLGAEQLPLQQGLSAGSYALDRDITVMILGVSGEAELIRARVGIFYHATIAGCSCADDPTPVDEHSEYCEVQVEIEKTTSEAKVTLLPE